MPNISDQPKSRSAAPMLGIAVAAVGLVAGRREHKVESGFQERAQAAGIAFPLNFVPKEQGEHFKINLYDLGSGLAVGNYDNDGRASQFIEMIPYALTIIALAGVVGRAVPPAALGKVEA
jgi:hypothetical protein